VTHHRNIPRSLGAVAAVAVLSMSCAGAQAQGSPDNGRARASAHHVQWTQLQLDQLARAYAEKNPGWVPPEASTARTPAQKTWTPAALDALSGAYSALNPDWRRP
jgi:hypothetical protein